MSALAEKVRLLFDQLRSFGQKPLNMMPTLLDIVKNCPDEGLKGYVQSTLNDYFDDKLQLDNENLLTRIESNYKIRVEDGSYNIPTADQQKIIALEARLSDLLAKHAKETCGGKSKGNSNCRSQEWMLKPPSASNDKCKKDGNVWTIQRGSKKFIWCEHHKKWGRLKTTECKASQRTNDDSQGNSPPTTEGAGLRLEAQIANYLMDDVSP